MKQLNKAITEVEKNSEGFKIKVFGILNFHKLRARVKKYPTEDFPQYFLFLSLSLSAFPVNWMARLYEMPFLSSCLSFLLCLLEDSERFLLALQHSICNSVRIIMMNPMSHSRMKSHIRPCMLSLQAYVQHPLRHAIERAFKYYAPFYVEWSNSNISPSSCHHCEIKVRKYARVKFYQDLRTPLYKHTNPPTPSTPTESTHLYPQLCITYYAHKGLKVLPKYIV